MNKLKKKLLLDLMLIAFIPTILLGGYSLYSSYQSLYHNSIISLKSQTSLTGERMETFLENVSSDVFYLRDSSAIQFYLSVLNSKDNKSQGLLRNNIELSFREFVGNKKIYHQARFINKQGMEVVRINYDGNKAKIVPEDKLQNKKGRYYFDDSIKLPKNDLMISPLDLNREKGKIEYPIRPTIRFATPVFNKTEELQGVVIVNVLAEKMLNIINRQESNGNNTAFIDKEGYYFYYSDESKVWGSKRDLATGESLFTDYPDIKPIIVNSENLGKATSDDNVIFYKKIWVNSAQHFIGTLINLVPESTVFKPLFTFILVFLAITLLALLLTFIVASKVSNTLSKPLATLKEEVKRLANGDLDSPIDVETDDEIGDVSHEVEKLRRSMKILMNRNQ
ncbi:MAG: cache and HAMP domain-containing protein [Cocleimonas sp.]|nr:cache and HAMP domain-containing protein [Cocleimonas sp.]